MSIEMYQAAAQSQLQTPAWLIEAKSGAGAFLD